MNVNKVFGIGLGRTGTSSLTLALYALGIVTKHYPWDEVTHHELRTCQYRLTLLDEFQGITDITVAPFYAQLDAQYPGSKFILTVRDKESWLQSIQGHRERMSRHWNAEDQERQFGEFINACVYGCAVGVFDRERFSHVYDTHVRNVLEYFQHRPDDLLVFDLCGGEGWEKLCPFLGLDVPARRFPHGNRAWALTE